MPQPTPPDPDALGPGSEAALHWVSDLQKDGRVLLRFVARRPDRPLAAASQMGLRGAPEGFTPYNILTADPRKIAANADLLTMLVGCIDDLSRRAAPATVATIRLSAAYLRVKLEDAAKTDGVPGESGEPPQHVIRRARWLRFVVQFIAIAGIATTILSVLLLAHVDDGRRAVQQLEQSRAELARTYSELAKLPLAAWVVLPPQAGGEETPDTPAAAAQRPFLPFCASPGPASADEPARRVPSASDTGAQAAALCSQLDQASLRENIVFLRLASWNCRTYWIYRIVTLNGLLDPDIGDGPCGTVPFVPHRTTAQSDEAAKMEQHWQRTEIRTAGAISVLTGFILPLLLGCVGGCAYALRRLDQRLSDWVLEVQDGSHSFMRVLLATMLGGLLGVLWTGNEQVQLSGFTLSVAALAFFVGFSLEVVFTVIEAMVDGVAGKLRASPGAPPPAASSMARSV